ncbi:MAG: hypothetical protein ACE5FU_01880 [Nitrospinota bacterium]
MKNSLKNIPKETPGQRVCSLLIVLLLISSCASVDPNRVTVDLEKTIPKAKNTNYTQALRKLGLMTAIYESEILRIQSSPINDKTGTSGSTGGEIPRDITEMLKSALNSIGGNVTYIPYDPAFVQNQMVTGYSEFADKVIPDVILSGGITEFDRGLETKGENTDASAGAELRGLSDQFPSKDLSLMYGQAGKRGLARITLDFNLVDFKTMTGVPRMNVINTMEVKKALKGKELGISIFGQSFGRKGEIKKVQGRHNAVRLLVELSMIQMVGKYGALPYWRLVGEEAIPDEDVLRSIARFYRKLKGPDVVRIVQEWLFLHGYEVWINGELDEATLAALNEVSPGASTSSGDVGLETFRDVYLTIPVNEETLIRRKRLNAILTGQVPAGSGGTPSQNLVETSASAEEAPPLQKFHEQMGPESAFESSGMGLQPEQSSAVKKIVKKRITVGRILREKEW